MNFRNIDLKGDGWNHCRCASTCLSVGSFNLKTNQIRKKLFCIESITLHCKSGYKMEYTFLITDSWNILLRFRKSLPLSFGSRFEMHTLSYMWQWLNALYRLNHKWFYLSGWINEGVVRFPVCCWPWSLVWSVFENK